MPIFKSMDENIQCIDCGGFNFIQIFYLNKPLALPDHTHFRVQCIQCEKIYESPLKLLENEDSD